MCLVRNLKRVEYAGMGKRRRFCDDELQILLTAAFLFFFGTDSTDSPGLFTVTSEHTRFLLFSFSALHSLVAGSVR